MPAELYAYNPRQLLDFPACLPSSCPRFAARQSRTGNNNLPSVCVGFDTPILLYFAWSIGWPSRTPILLCRTSEKKKKREREGKKKGKK